MSPFYEQEQQQNSMSCLSFNIKTFHRIFGFDLEFSILVIVNA